MAPERLGERAAEAADGALGAVAGEPAPVQLPLRLHADAVEALLELVPPVAAPPRLDARHVRAVEPGALLSLRLLAAYHGFDEPALPVPADALIAPVAVADPLAAATLFEAVGGETFGRRLAALGWTPMDASKLATLVRELARNALEHAGAPATVAAWRTAPGELRVAVADAGVGFSGSLRMGDEREALLRGVIYGASGRAVDGLGRGLRRVGQLLAGWGGVMRVRSRTVALRGVPPWNDATLEAQLAFLPGVVVEVAVPSPPLRGMAGRPPPARA